MNQTLFLERFESNLIVKSRSVISFIANVLGIFAITAITIRIPI